MCEGDLLLEHLEGQEAVGTLSEDRGADRYHFCILPSTLLVLALMGAIFVLSF